MKLRKSCWDISNRCDGWKKKTERSSNDKSNGSSGKHCIPLWPKKKDEKGDSPNEKSGKGDIVREVIKKLLDHFNKTVRAFGESQSEKIRKLSGKNQKADARGETNNHWIGDKFNNGAKTKNSHEDEKNAGHKSSCE